MSAAARLAKRQEELLAALDCGRVPSWARSDLREHVQLTLEAWAGREEAARRRAAERWLATHELIRGALGTAPLDLKASVLVGVARLRLGDRAPRRNTILEHVRELQKEGGTEPKRRAKRATVRAEINAKGAS